MIQFIQIILKLINLVLWQAPVLFRRWVKFRCPLSLGSELLLLRFEFLGKHVWNLVFHQGATVVVLVSAEGMASGQASRLRVKLSWRVSLESLAHLHILEFEQHLLFECNKMVAPLFLCTDLAQVDASHASVISSQLLVRLILLVAAVQFALARLGWLQVVELLLARVLHFLLDLDLDINIFDHLHPDSLLERFPSIVLSLSLKVKSLPREL